MASSESNPATPPPEGVIPDGRSVDPRQCGHCNERGRELRRGLCALCYDQWIRSRPVGIGAVCASCSDRRRAHLRYVEVPRHWLILCHNCTARADALRPSPARVDDLLTRLGRERRSRREADAEADVCDEVTNERRASARGGAEVIALDAFLRPAET